ncbi:MAG: hypothetical protein IKN59_07850 [Paludibacteraceae bacterium]|nr:hypothetical protein [Paludibacteraceae bacterium]
METIVQWATILSPIIAVIIAVLASRHSAKETAKHIDSINESTRLQVESIKELAKIQVKTSQIQINKELWEARAKFLQANERQAEAQRMSMFSYQNINDAYSREEKYQEISYEKDFHQKHVKILEGYQKDLINLSKELEG